jgi:hypothetical protein
MTRLIMRRSALLALAALVLAAVAATSSAMAHGKPRGHHGHHGHGSKTVILFSSDGMRPDLMLRYEHHGLMPNYRRLIKEGVAGKNGLRQAFPPNTGVGWYTLATGAYPAQTGSTNNTFYDTTTPFTTSMSAFQPGVLQADSLQQEAERHRKTVACFEWTTCGAIVPKIQGPVVDGESFFSKSAVLVNFDLPGQPAKVSEAPIPSNVVNLMDALRRSVDAEAASVPAKRAPSKARAEQAPSKKPAAKKGRSGARKAG